MGWSIYRSQGLPNFVRSFNIGIGIFFREFNETMAGGFQWLKE